MSTVVFQATLPAGMYFIGDPCLAFDDEEWYSVLDSTEYLGADTPASSYFGEWKGHKFVALSTLIGDGYFISDQWQAFHVDTGMIGAVPEALARKTPLLVATIFTEPFDVKKMSDGTLIFGHILVDTSESEETGDEYYGDEEDTDDE